MKFNKKWFTLIELIFASIITMFIIGSIYTIAIDSYKKYNSYRIKGYVLQENTKFLKYLWRIRYWEGINYIDKNPVNHPNISDITINLPEWKQISYQWDDLWINNTNDISFIDTDGNELYMYDKDIIEFKKFEITPLDPDIHRWWVRIHIIMWTSWRYDPIKNRINRKATKLFGNTSFFLDYYITYTFRNVVPPTP